MFSILSVFAAIGRSIVTRRDDLPSPTASDGRDTIGRREPAAGPLALEWRVSLATRWLANPASEPRGNLRLENGRVKGEHPVPRAPSSAPRTVRCPEPIGHEPFAIRHMPAMIARLWSGKTSAAKAEEYLEYVRMTGVKDYTKTPGNQGVRILRRIAGDQAEFMVLSMWDSLEAIQGFAGPDYEKAVYYPEDRKYLEHLDPEVSHFEVVLDTAATTTKT